MSAAKIVFGRLDVATKRVHVERVSCTLETDRDGSTSVCIRQSHSKGSDWGSQWGRAEADCFTTFGSCRDGSFFRDEAIDGETIWLETVSFLSALLSYHPGIGHAPKRTAWDELRQRCIEHCADWNEYEHFIRNGTYGAFPMEASEMLWPTILAFAQKHKNTPAFRVWSGVNCVQSDFPIRPIGDGAHCVCSIGPWGFKVDRDVAEKNGVRLYNQGRRPAGKLVDVSWVQPDQRETYELKRWLHGYKSKHDTVKEVMKQAVRRRIIKHRVTDADIQFFQTIFGVSQVGRWIKEAANKNNHDNTHAGRN